VTKEPFYLHMASSLATVGIVASQKVIWVVAYFSEMLCGGTLAAPSSFFHCGLEGQLYSLWWVGGKASQLRTLWLAARPPVPLAVALDSAGVPDPPGKWWLGFLMLLLALCFGEAGLAQGDRGDSSKPADKKQTKILPIYSI
jgi:hypothetical protein